MSSAVQTAAVKEQEFKVVAIGQVRESPRNPRRTFDGKAQQDLEASIREKGIIVPLLVRPTNGSFEIVAGARRFRAAKRVGLGEIPVLVRELTDDQALEAQVIENLQRCDVHPLEEAEGYKELIRLAKYDVAEIARKVGKSGSYIYQRLKLADLTPTLKKDFLAGEISPGHAILLARLEPSEQDALWKHGLFERRWNAGQTEDQPITVRALGKLIAEQIHRSLAAAPWKKDDATLLPKAGPCTTCPHRAGNQAELFADISKPQDTCTKPVCYQAKLAAYAEGRVQDIRKEDGKAAKLSESHSKPPAGALGQNQYDELNGKKRACKDTVRGVFVDGNRVGQVARVCAAGEKCKIHNTYHYAPARESAQAKAAAKRKVAKERRDAEIRRRLVRAVLAKVTGPLKRKDLERVVLAHAREMWHERQKAVVGLFGWAETPKKRSGGWRPRDDAGVIARRLPQLNETELARLMMSFVLVRAGDANDWRVHHEEKLEGVARSFGVSAKTIAKQLDAEARKTAKQAPKKAAKKH